MYANLYLESGQVAAQDRWVSVTTLVLLLIARTNFSEFSDDWHNR